MKIFYIILCAFICGTLNAVTSEYQVIRNANVRVFFELADERRAIEILKAVNKEKLDLEHFFSIQLDEPVSIYLPAEKEDVHTLVGVSPPVWSAALYVPSRNAIILLRPEWQQGFQDPIQSLRHEMVHWALHLRFSGRHLPNYFEEGLAEWVAGERIDIQKGVILANALVSKKVVPFNEFAGLLKFNPARAHLAYVQSLTVVQFLHNQFLKSEENWQKFLKAIEEDGFETALIKFTGLDLVDFEIAWYRWMSQKYRWFVVFNLENLIWIGMVVILAGALYALRFRNRKRMQDMADDELPFWDELE